MISGGIKHPKAVLDSGQQGDAGLCHEGEEVPHLRELYGHHHLGDLQGRLRVGQRLSALNLLVLALIIISMELSEHNVQHKYPYISVCSENTILNICGTFPTA